jgi:hypothetical protein
MTRCPRIAWLPRLALALVLLAAAGRPAAAGVSDCGPWSLTVLVDGVPAPEYGSRGRVYLEALRGRTFSLRLSNPTSERIAIALSVDGRNVIDAKRTSAGAAAKWILLPGQTADIPGWQVSGESARRFFFTETRRSYARWLGDTSNAGTIEAVFFRERHRLSAQPAWVRPDPLEEGLRRESGNPSSDSKASRDSAASADTIQGGVEGGVPGGVLGPPAAARVAPRRESDRFAATGIGEKTWFEIQWTSFDEDPSPAARVLLRYEFRSELVRLGVLPREDDLYARDRGRGFEREYAPDPYRHR